MRNFKLLLEYDGSRYRGWQRLADSDMTIQGKLEAVLSRMSGEAVEVIGSGRTDAGAHAKGQVANFHCDTTMNCKEILEYLRQYLPEDIGVINLEEVSPRFHSRYHAVEKTYRYRIWNSDMPNVFARKYTWKMTDPLNIDSMREGAQKFLGEHDFLAFCSNKHFKKSSVRRITSIQIDQEGPEILFTVSGDGFLYNMVRIMVGTLVAIGRGTMRAEDIPVILEGRIREKAGETVPAKGLCLMEVRYE